MFTKGQCFRSTEWQCNIVVYWGLYHTVVISATRSSPGPSLHSGHARQALLPDQPQGRVPNDAAAGLCPGQQQDMTQSFNNLVIDDRLRIEEVEMCGEADEDMQGISYVYKAERPSKLNLCSEARKKKGYVFSTDKS